LRGDLRQREVEVDRLKAEIATLRAEREEWMATVEYAKWAVASLAEGWEEEVAPIIKKLGNPAAILAARAARDARLKNIGAKEALRGLPKAVKENPDLLKKNAMAFWRRRGWNEFRSKVDAAIALLEPEAQGTEAQKPEAPGCWR
jgi:hypothetical protein